MSCNLKGRRVSDGHQQGSPSKNKMADPLARSLDDMISEKQKTKKASFLAKREKLGGGNNFSSKNTSVLAKRDKQEREQVPFPSKKAFVPSSDNSSSTKILITRLDKGISCEDIKDIFQSVGNVVSITMFFDNGFPSGKAEVTYSSPDAAAASVVEFDNREVDNSRIRVRVIASSTPSGPAPIITKHFQAQKGTQQNNQQQTQQPRNVSSVFAKLAQSVAEHSNESSKKDRKPVEKHVEESTRERKPFGGRPAAAPVNEKDLEDQLSSYMKKKEEAPATSN
jgi:RNA recognition motif. (a.k.a. RRM, RBD, or RNP domain)